MECPVCASRLAEAGVGEVAVDECGSCRGLWLDAGEWERIAGAREAAAVPPAEAAEERDALECPRCRTRTLVLGGASAAPAVRRCTRCGGRFVPEEVLPITEREVTPRNLLRFLLEGILGGPIGLPPEVRAARAERERDEARRRRETRRGRDERSG